MQGTGKYWNIWDIGINYVNDCLLICNMNISVIESLIICTANHQGRRYRGERFFAKQKEKRETKEKRKDFQSRNY